MESDILNKLRKIAFRFKIDPVNTFGNAASLETVIKVLQQLNKSYNSFLSIEFSKQSFFSGIEQTMQKKLLGQLQLLIVDINYSSFSAAVAPDIYTENEEFTSNIKIWEKTAYNEYKDVIIKGDFEKPDYIDKISQRFSEEERSKIYKPLFDSFGDGKEYQFLILDSKMQVEKSRIKPGKENMKLYIPKISKLKKITPEYKTMEIYAKVEKDADIKSLKKGSIKEVLFYKAIEADTYPYISNEISFENHKYILDEEIECRVKFEEENYIIEYDDLDIVVWGESREEAEQAFAFAFDSLYSNYAVESNENLTEKAINLKKKINSLVREVITTDETEKN